MLTHAGASGVGTAAVQLVRLFGAVPIVTAGSPEKLNMAKNLGAAAAFNYKEESFVQGVHDFTQGESWSRANSSLCFRGSHGQIFGCCCYIFTIFLSKNVWL